jgi:peptidoglycan/xylan/chitin deacetylase (PgdA/CDA1 family)
MTRWAVPLAVAGAVLWAVAFSLGGERRAGQGPGAAGPPGALRDAPIEFTRRIAEDAGSAQAPLLFCIGIHVEPQGAVVSSLAGRGDLPPRGPPPRRPPGPAGAERPEGPLPPAAGGEGGPTRPPPFAARPPPNFNDRPYFQHTVDDLGILAAMAERHGGRLAVQVQTPFTRVAAEAQEAVLADLEKRGHEISLHFHEDAHLGPACERLAVETWAAVMKEEIGWIRKAGVKSICYWSGGNLYPGLLDAASRAGLDVMSDYKNPHVQRSDDRLQAVVPWRPSGGPAESDLAAFARHDPGGKVIYLPVGVYPSADFAALKRSGGDVNYFDLMTDGLERSLRAARKDRVSVFHVTVHPGEFRGSPREPYAVIDKWLTEIVAPLVKAGKVRWATFSQMADAYVQWEKAHAGVDPREGQKAAVTAADAPPVRAGQAAAPGTAADVPRGYITFVINVHDTRHVGESAETVRRAIGIFRKFGVRGDFYLTAPMVERYAAERPDVIAILKETRQTVSYHVRPPHPIYADFEGPLRGLDEKALAAALRDYETFRLDPATGGLDRTAPGGYAYVAKVFGSAPVAVGAPTGDPRVRRAALVLYRDLGARAVVQYHESGTDPERPFERIEGLLARPSDFSITRWALAGEPVESFWWNRLDGPQAADYNPAARLKSQLAAWKGGRPPFITALIHESDFARGGPVSWSSIYYAGENPRVPRVPPFRLDAPDPSRPRAEAERERIWQAYEEMVALAAANLRVVTSEDIVAMAGAQAVVRR